MKFSHGLSLGIISALCLHTTSARPALDLGWERPLKLSHLLQSDDGAFIDFTISIEDQRAKWRSLTDCRIGTNAVPTKQFKCTIPEYSAWFDKGKYSPEQESSIVVSVRGNGGHPREELFKIMPDTVGCGGCEVRSSTDGYTGFLADLGRMMMERPFIGTGAFNWRW